MKLAEAYIEIRGDMRPLRRDIRAGGRASRMVMAAGGRMGRAFSRAFSGALRRGLRMAKWGLLALIGATTAAVYSFAEFEKQLNMIATMLDEQTMRLLPGYRRALQSMAVEFGESTETLAKGLYDILSASIPAEKAIKVLDVAVRAGRAGMSDAATATDVITTLLNAYGLEAEKATYISDILFATVKRGKLTFGELAPSIGMVASTAKMANVTVEELGAMLALMTRAGINSHEAATSLNGILRAFLKPASDATKQAKKFGLELSSNTIRTKGLYGAMKLIRGATAEEIATMFPRIRGMKGVAAAIQNIDAFSEDLAFTQNAGGRMMEAYQKTARGTAFELSRLRQQVVQTSRNLAELLAPQINETVGALREWVGANEDLIRQKFGALVKEMTTVMAGIPDWWEREGRVSFQEMVDWLKTAVAAVQKAKAAFDLVRGKPVTPRERLGAGVRAEQRAALEVRRGELKEELRLYRGAGRGVAPPTAGGFRRRLRPMIETQEDLLSVIRQINNLDAAITGETKRRVAAAAREQMRRARAGRRAPLVPLRIPSGVEEMGPPMRVQYTGQRGTRFTEREVVFAVQENTAAIKHLEDTIGANRGYD